MVGADGRLARSGRLGQPLLVEELGSDRFVGSARSDVEALLRSKDQAALVRERQARVLDAVRACKIGLDRKIGGSLLSASSYFMKSPPVQYADAEARDAVERFIHGDLPR